MVAVSEPRDVPGSGGIAVSDLGDPAIFANDPAITGWIGTAETIFFGTGKRVSTSTDKKQEIVFFMCSYLVIPRILIHAGSIHSKIAQISQPALSGGKRLPAGPFCCLTGAFSANILPRAPGNAS